MENERKIIGGRYAIPLGVVRRNEYNFGDINE